MSHEFLRFLVVGSIGFVIDAGVLQVLVANTPLGPYSGRVVSYLVAATATWSLNRSYTFRTDHSPVDAKSQWLMYVMVNGVGGGINYAVYGLCIAQFAWMRDVLFLAVAAGSVAALLFNFVANKFWVFRPRTNH